MSIFTGLHLHWHYLVVVTLAKVAVHLNGTFISKEVKQIQITKMKQKTAS